VAVFGRRPPKLAAGSRPGSITGVVLSVDGGLALGGPSAISGAMSMG